VRNVVGRVSIDNSVERPCIEVPKALLDQLADLVAIDKRLKDIGTQITTRLRLALDATGHDGTPIEFALIRSDEQAHDLDFRGSPTVLLNDRDPFATPDEPVGLACRLYGTPIRSPAAP
jgi:hypothetical protein